MEVDGQEFVSQSEFEQVFTHLMHFRIGTLHSWVIREIEFDALNLDHGCKGDCKQWFAISGLSFGP
jgi:hypothetical protein